MWNNNTKTLNSEPVSDILDKVRWPEFSKTPKIVFFFMFIIKTRYKYRCEWQNASWTHQMLNVTISYLTTLFKLYACPCSCFTSKFRFCSIELVLVRFVYDDTFLVSEHKISF